ncbi:MAG: phosphoribosylformylglycinamidine synthase subunit PurL [Methanomassiliicoccaceae archaeon]|jgi:phosphoribosylformylglycinamidine synthase|nr:phosphoribosylformylglycinamidine synthase subunit PurL [Methanomassiliicoccaceae archaeon]
MAPNDLMMKRDVPFQLYDIKIRDAKDDDLGYVSKELGLGLSLDEMKTVKKYFVSEKRDPTDIELQSLGQAWSEHCCYKSSKLALKEYVFGIDHKDVMSRGDAGVMRFDKKHGYALRIESHNHPSAVEPYGGAATGVGGILRDVVCMGADPVGVVDPFCFGMIDTTKKLPKGTKHPKELLKRAVDGGRDYCNVVNVPCVSGAFFFDERYTGNCLVNVGALGIVRNRDLRNNFVSGPGEILVLCGEPTGRDGIHGVNFASVALETDAENRSAKHGVSPIPRRFVLAATLEANKAGLVTGMKDLGGGGLSCVVGEMALGAGCGAEVNLDKAPLREKDMDPWEIWVSETQERMMLAVKEKNVKKVLAIFKKHKVPAVAVGKSTDVPRTRIFWKNELIFDMDLEFLTGGPVYRRPYDLPKFSTKEDEKMPKLPANDDIILSLLSDLNISSREWAIKQFEKKGKRTVAGPTAGSGPGDASVIAPVAGSDKGLAVTVGCNPWLVAADPYRGSKGCIDETCRNLVAVGARPHAFTDCLNFGNPEKPDRMGVLRESVRGLGEMAKNLKIPIPSGNVSLYNESSNGVCILPTPMVIGTGLIADISKTITADLKGKGNMLFLIGDTRDEMGGSLLFRKYGGEGGAVPDADPAVLKRLMDRLLKAMGDDLVLSCHDCSDGGFAVAMAEMCIAGNVGADLDLSKIKGTDTVKLYSESNSRWIAEVSRDNADAFKKILGRKAVLIGKTAGSRLKIADADVDVAVKDMKAAWKAPVGKVMRS